jgi:hypothetical protein
MPATGLGDETVVVSPQRFGFDHGASLCCSR